MLSPQEQKLYNLMLQDKSMGDIAREMDLDPRTISTYANNIYKKIGVKTRIGVVREHYGGILSDMKRVKRIQT